ncbi:flavin reductase family protein [Streptomyces calvus]|jgi:flavin reductase (DIM6/NTAB) family NADH-FMN oxidoreductase RutF|uniref:flavin reductase family protein n=1 Tax=Streptomyces calvus TaxID=67282 RepID=UPI00371D806D
MPSLLGTDLRHTFAAYPTGMAMIAAEVDGRDEAMLANSFTTVSLDPPLVSMAFTHVSTTWPRLRRATELGITVLGAPQRDLVPQLRRSGPARLAGIDLERASDQARTLTGAAAVLVVRPHRFIPAGDHELVLFEVVDHHRDDAVSPLTYFARRVGVAARV